ncbi:UNVERIFIED_ORG: phage protein U [Paraburkholderia sediminicola]|nr:phage protein U [Paraburkholderia sediminicola]
MMLSLDHFVFSLTTAPYKELQRQRNWKHRTSSRVGVRDASQYNGPGDDTITLNGMVAADNRIGTRASLDELGKMGDAGDAYVLVDGMGTVFGAFIIDGLNETATYHTPEGIPRKIEFSLTLKRVADETLAALQGDGKETESAAASRLNDIRAVSKVASDAVERVKNLSLNSIKAGAITVAATMAPGAAEAAIKGLSTGSGEALDKALSAAKDISSGNGEAVAGVVSYILEKSGGA